MRNELIKYLSREYPLATSDEIAKVIGVAPGVVRYAIKGHARDDSADRAEYRRRKRSGLDQDLIKIMRRRLVERQKARAA